MAEVGPTERLHTGEPEELEYASTVMNGWRTITAKKAIEAVKLPAGDMGVLTRLSVKRAASEAAARGGG